MRILLSLTLLFSSVLAIGAAQAKSPVNCELAIACEVGNRSYHVRLPDNWDGKTPLPVLLHFHGWGRQGKMIMNHSRIAGATRKMGVLLLAPNGNGRSWDFWNEDTDDIAFASAVLKDAAKNWPIDQSKIFVSGYSYGSAMAWRFACATGKNINSILAISGTLRDENEHCEAPVNVRHVHGTKDTVMGYPYGKDGDVEGAVALWRNRNRCNSKSDSQKTETLKTGFPYKRHIWSNCASGKSIILDVHKRGHFIPRQWIAKQLEQLL